MTITNGVLMPFVSQLKVVAPNLRAFDDMARRLGIGLNRDGSVPTYFDWTTGPRFITDQRMDNYREFTKWLRSSRLTDCDTLIMSFRVEDPVVEVPVRLFVESWEVFDNAGQGETNGFTPDGSCVIEFRTDRIYTTFPWAPEHFGRGNGHP